MKYPTLISLSIFVASLTNAQEKIPRAESLISSDQIKETMIYQTSPWGEGEAMYYHAPDVINSEKVIRAFHSPLDPTIYKMNWFDNDILDYKTLRPLFKKHPLGSIHYNYEKKGSVALTFISRHGVVHKEIALANHNFVMSGPSVPILVSSLPLKVGLKTKFSSISIGFPYVEEAYDPKIVNYLLHVTSTDTVRLNGKDYKTFVVEVYPETPKEKGVFYKAWATQSSPHTTIKWIYTPSKNKDKDNSERIISIRKLIRLEQN